MIRFNTQDSPCALVLFWELKGELLLERGILLGTGRFRPVFYALTPKCVKRKTDLSFKEIVLSSGNISQDTQKEKSCFEMRVWFKLFRRKMNHEKMISISQTH